MRPNSYSNKKHNLSSILQYEVKEKWEINSFSINDTFTSIITNTLALNLSNEIYYITGSSGCSYKYVQCFFQAPLWGGQCHLSKSVVLPPAPPKMLTANTIHSLNSCAVPLPPPTQRKWSEREIGHALIESSKGCHS